MSLITSCVKENSSFSVCPDQIHYTQSQDDEVLKELKFLRKNKPCKQKPCIIMIDIFLKNCTNMREQNKKCMK
jgi:hypothetical protein